MIQRFAMSAALLALVVAPVQAQTFPDPAAAGANQGGMGWTGPLFIGGTPFQFVPGVGFVPQGTTTLANGYANSDPLGFNSGFVPGVASGFLFNPYLYGISGPYTNYPNLRRTPGLVPTGAVPPVWNAAVAANRARAQANGRSGRRQARARSAAPRIPTEIAAARGTRIERERVAGSRQESTSGPATMTRAEKEDELRASHRIETLMRNRPITEGELIRLGATGAQVRITINGEVRTERYPVENVFFFADDGRLATAFQAPDEVVPGARVLVPIPITEATVTTTPAAGSVTERVAGSRQTTKKAARKPVKKAATRKRK